MNGTVSLTTDHREMNLLICLPGRSLTWISSFTSLQQMAFIWCISQMDSLNINQTCGCLNHSQWEIWTSSKAAAKSSMQWAGVCASHSLKHFHIQHFHAVRKVHWNMLKNPVFFLSCSALLRNVAVCLPWQHLKHRERSRGRSKR